MPPKRKAAEASGTTEATSTRATRSSARTSAGAKADEKPAKMTAKPKTARASNKRTKEIKDDGDDELVSEPPAKKPKTTKTKATSKAAKGKRTAARDEPTDDGESGESSAKAKPASKQVSDVNAKYEPYTAARALALFEKYTDDDDPATIGPSGLERLCTDAKIPMEGAMPLILAWQLDAREMGTFTKDEWVKGTSQLKVSSLSALFTALSDLESLLIFGKAPVKSNSKTDPYDRTSYVGYAQGVKSAFQKLYMFCFNLAKPEQSRNIDMETSVALWSVVLLPKYPIMEDVIEFIGEKESVYKATNKDIWTMMLEFCGTVKADLQDYESDGAWPTLLDDFVAWKTAKTS